MYLCIFSPDGRFVTFEQNPTKSSTSIKKRPFVPFFILTSSLFSSQGIQYQTVFSNFVNNKSSLGRLKPKKLKLVSVTATYCGMLRCFRNFSLGNVFSPLHPPAVCGITIINKGKKTNNFHHVLTHTTAISTSLLIFKLSCEAMTNLSLQRLQRHPFDLFPFSPLFSCFYIRPPVEEFFLTRASRDIRSYFLCQQPTLSSSFFTLFRSQSIMKINHDRARCL